MSINCYQLYSWFNMKHRISIAKENRIWNLRCQGYCYDIIGRLANCNPTSVTEVLRRVRRRPSVKDDPIKRGRHRGFLSDHQINIIRRRREQGETYEAIGKSYQVNGNAIRSIALRLTYKEPEYNVGYSYDFSNRLTRWPNLGITYIIKCISPSKTNIQSPANHAINSWLHWRTT